MKTLGIIGGIAPGSTVDYYRAIIELYRERNPDGGYPALVINSIDLDRMLGHIGAGELDEVAAWLADEIERLTRAGCDLALLASNTPHVVFDTLRARSTIPLISIVESVLDVATAGNLGTLGLIGTRFTMQGRFYVDTFAAKGVTVVVPNPEDQEYVHGKYVSELIPGTFLPQTRNRMLHIIERMRDELGIQAVILGGTELPLLLGRDGHDGIPFLDSTTIHVDRAVAAMLSP